MKPGKSRSHGRPARRRRAGRGRQSRGDADRRRRRDVSAGARQPGARARRRDGQGALATRCCRATLTTTARGVAYWPGDGEHRRASSDGRTDAPRARRGDRRARRADSAQDGMVEIDVPWNGVPMIYKHVAILGRHHRRGAARTARRHARVRRPHRQEALGLPHRAAAGRARPRDLARQRLARSLGRQRLGVVHDARRGARRALHAGRRRRRRTTGAAIGPARTCSATRSWPSTPRPAATAGISKPSTTISGTRTCRIRPCSSTSCKTAGACRRSASVGKTGWMFILNRETGKPSSASRSGRCRKATCPASGTRRRSRSR